MNKQRIKELALANGFKLKEQHDGVLDLNPYVYEFAAAIEEELQAQVKRLKECFTQLINESVGVYGLHKNGDIAQWSELMPGGRFEEWLLPLSETPAQSLAALKAEWQAEAIESMLNLEHGYMQFEDGSFAYTEEAISGYATSIRQRAQEAGDA